MKNLDPNALKIGIKGWSAEDRARNLMDIMNSEYNAKAWNYAEIVKKTFPISGTHDFVEGFLLAALFMGEVISGGKVRECIKNRDGCDDLDALMMQRLLSWIEIEKKSDKKEEEKK